MENLPAILEAIAALLWPLLLVVLVVRFSPAVGGIIDSAKSRKFTLKVGGQELTMEEVREQQSTLIADLQSKVAALMALTGTPPEGTAAMDESALPPAGPSPTDATAGSPRVLWVDDEPRNNSFLIDRLTKAGIEVDLALTTKEGLAKAARSEYRVVVSDIGREEGGVYNGDAGLEFLQAFRERSPNIPLAFFTTAAGVRHRRGEASQLGADLITSSATDLVQFLSSNLPGWRG